MDRAVLESRRRIVTRTKPFKYIIHHHSQAGTLYFNHGAQASGCRILQSTVHTHTQAARLRMEQRRHDLMRKIIGTNPAELLGIFCLNNHQTMWFSGHSCNFHNELPVHLINDEFSINAALYYSVPGFSICFRYVGIKSRDRYSLRVVIKEELIYCH